MTSEVAVRAPQERSVRTRAALLAAAASVIGREGLDGASVDAIAREAGRTSGSLYGQFGSKDGLVFALLDSMRDQVATRMRTELLAAETLDERLLTLWRNYADPPAGATNWVRLEHELWRWATHGEAGSDRPVRATLIARYRATTAGVAELLRGWIDEGLIAPSLRVGRLASVVLAALVGLEMQHRLDPSATDDATVLSALRALLGAR